ncbi:hypothetical protein BGW36DRAFT_400061 [Talaromyces proteolyticus]|uniref:Uncharacterized protein n=1 Tax=Talaromyces proteolyticus TaxID=1131652 RepID=A0AAD4KHJ8_9EURO|nr:uncharacterized protein BGW36DRAFT_400061 [Talaromyces proteolyticus]KAH8691935.1 hypothetical protein BGW36DRAFT_400061 [Talaromyces proteolyticus]
MDRSLDYEALFLESEKRREEAEREREEAERERDQLKEETQRTTIAEFIQYCHQYISEPLQIEMNKERSTSGSLTSPKGRLCPTYLKPWEGFHQRQAEVYQEVLGCFNSLENPRLFSSRTVVQGLGNQLCRRPQSSEGDLWTYGRLGMEDPTAEVLEALRANSDFPLGDGIQFDNHANTFDDEPVLPDALKRKRSQPDQFCVHRKDAENTLLYFIEDKATHKLTPENLRAGLQTMNVWDKVVQRPTIPLDRDEKLQYNAELLTNSALTHAYDSMMNRGLGHAVLRTGSCLVFLYIAEDDPETLRYCLTEPNLDVTAMSNAVTAVGRLLAFCLMSLEIPVRSQRWRNEVIPQLHTWEVDFEYILSQIPDDEIHSTPPGSEYIPSSSPLSSFSESHNTRTHAGCRPGDIEQSSPTDDSESDDVSGNISGARKRTLSHFSSSPPQRQHRSGRQNKRTNRPAPTESLDFCTQRCLRGMKTGRRLDESCPNVTLHRRASDNHHPINCVDFAIPFKLSLMPYGYTVIGKGTTDRGWEEVQREVEVYDVLRTVQGSAVPVFLGSVHSSQMYFYKDAKIKHFLLLSWCGDEFDWTDWNQEQWDIYRQTVQEIQHLGINPGKLHRSNVLWTPRRSHARITGFHQAKPAPQRPGKRKLAALNNNISRKRVRTT